MNRIRTKYRKPRPGWFAVWYTDIPEDGSELFRARTPKQAIKKALSTFFTEDRKTDFSAHRIDHKLYKFRRDAVEKKCHCCGSYRLVLPWVDEPICQRCKSEAFKYMHGDKNPTKEEK